jgi:hypothetical protein
MNELNQFETDDIDKKLQNQHVGEKGGVGGSFLTQYGKRWLPL